MGHNRKAGKACQTRHEGVTHPKLFTVKADSASQVEARQEP